MRTLALILAATTAVPVLLVSCANKDPEARKAVPPPSANSDIPWNSQGTQGGVGGFGMLPQNRVRR